MAGCPYRGLGKVLSLGTAKVSNGAEENSKKDKRVYRMVKRGIETLLGKLSVFLASRSTL